MNSKRRTILLPLLVVVTMLASLITPSPVLAAGEPPPPSGEKSPKSAPVVTKPAPPDSDASYSAEAPLAAPDGAASATPVALGVDALAQAGAVLVGADGSILPLAAQESVVPLGGGGLVSFKGSGGAECTAGYCYYGDIATALTNFFVRNGSGRIYAPGGLVEPGAVDVNGTTLSLSKLTGLAWDGKPTNYTPTINFGLLTIANMLKGFTVDGFYIGKGIYAHDNAGTLILQNLRVTNTTGSGIFVEKHTGNINLFNVTVYGATGPGPMYTRTAGDGAHLDNMDGTGNITISNSSFNGNLRYGLYVSTHGSVLLDRVDASNNIGWDGANLTVMKGATVKDSRFNGNLNTSNGLVIYSYGTGAVKLTNVEAQGNTYDGLSLHADSDISINGALLPGNTNGHGLEAYSGGNITLNNIISQGNRYSVVVNNYTLLGLVKTVTVTNSRFTGTIIEDGLQVKSKGNITLNHIVAEGNHGNGITIDNAQLDGGIYRGSGSVSLLNTLGDNELLNNTGFGLDVKSKGAITVKGLYADDGLNLDGCAVDPAPPHLCLGNGNLSVTATRLVSSGNDASLYAMAGGAITLSGDTFLGNMGGVTLNNTQASSAKAVTVNSSIFTNTLAVNAVPLSVLSKGNITLNHVQAMQNLTTQETILLDNCQEDSITHLCIGSGSVSVLSSLGPTILTNNNATTWSLSIISHGAVTLNGVSDEYNKNGTWVQNIKGTAAVTISKSSFSHNSVGSGLGVFSAGKIALTSVNASNNNGASGGGVDLDNTFAVSPAIPTITVSKSNFDNNFGYGLIAIAMGSLTANTISAMNNIGPAGFGGYLLSEKGNVGVQNSLGANQFSYNSVNGLTVLSGFLAAGTISLRGVTAHHNGTGYGIRVDNSYATTPMTVTIQKVSVDHNGLDGLDVLSKGSVTLNNVQTNYNSNGWGVNIDNCGLPAPCEGNGNVSLLSTLGANSASYNSTGMRIDTLGSVMVNGLTASYNTFNDVGVSGVYIYNLYQTAMQKPVTITKSSFDANQGAGLAIWATGVITLNGVSASSNKTSTGFGVYLYNASGPLSPGVSILATLGKNQFNNNAANGIYIFSSGNIALNKVTANNNGWSTTRSGAYLFTFNASSITITCGVFNNNKKYGLEVSMPGTGVLTLKGVTANLNDPVLGNLGLGGKVPVVSWMVCGM